MLGALGISYAGFLAAFASSVVLARALGTEGKGTFSLFQTTVAMVTVAVSFGIGHGQMYHCGKDPSKLRHFLPNAVAIAVGL
ncbi:MAG TPA: hypothetical protein VLX90_18240, partial [Steroidobacteraceae bacterium]|nr:hypothetical protein [Steroidobacteraceae bacterium]